MMRTGWDVDVVTKDDVAVMCCREPDHDVVDTGFCHVRFFDNDQDPVVMIDGTSDRVLRLKRTS